MKPIYSGAPTMPLPEVEDGVEAENGILCLGGPLKKKRIADTGAFIHVHEKHIYLRYRVNLSEKKYGPGAHEDFFVFEGIEGMVDLGTGGEPK